LIQEQHKLEDIVAYMVGEDMVVEDIVVGDKEDNMKNHSHMNYIVDYMTFYYYYYKIIIKFKQYNL